MSSPIALTPQPPTNKRKKPRETLGRSQSVGDRPTNNKKRARRAPPSDHYLNIESAREGDILVGCGVDGSYIAYVVVVEKVFSNSVRVRERWIEDCEYDLIGVAPAPPQPCCHEDDIYLVRRLKTPVLEAPVQPWLPAKLISCGEDGFLLEDHGTKFETRFTRFHEDVLFERRIGSFEWSKDQTVLHLMSVHPQLKHLTSNAFSADDSSGE